MKTLRRHPVQRPSNGFLCPTQNGFSAFGGLARAIGRWEGTRGGSRVPLGCTGLDPPLKGGPGRFDVPPGRAALAAGAAGWMADARAKTAAHVLQTAFEALERNMAVRDGEGMARCGRC